MIAADRVREVLEYHPDTGEFYWRTTARAKRSDRRAGHFEPDRYVTICVDGRKYYAHRLAWLYVHGTWPERNLDHKNEDKHDNRISNLRPATQSQNMLNVSQASARSKSGVRGVHPRRGKWCATIAHKYIGDFDTIEEAATAREAAL